jgi:hypothetical protein
MLIQWVEHTKKVDPDSDLVRIDISTMGVADEEFAMVVDVSHYADLQQRGRRSIGPRFHPLTAYRWT